MLPRDSARTDDRPSFKKHYASFSLWREFMDFPSYRKGPLYNVFGNMPKQSSFIGYRTANFWNNVVNF
ncbi:hypothetical protein SAMN05216420_108115 [Nitrosospira sp. Nl5]|nr:hypothetical protein SAMN05216420_108115 [Nitrosospira sp. Nl5]